MNGLVLASENADVSGLIITGFNQAGMAGIRVNSATGTDESQITGNFIGLDGAGTTNQGNTIGVNILGVNTHVGGFEYSERNVISGNGTGVRIGGTSAQDNKVRNNLIGTTKDGTGSDPNTGDGIRIENGATNNVIGEQIDIAGANVIAHNGGDGVRVIDGAGSANTVGNAIWGTNAIHSNGGMAIDLEGPSNAENGVTPNDVFDGDEGANNLQNAPELTHRQDNLDPFDNEFATNVKGVIKGIPGNTYEVHFYKVEACDSPFNRGEGAVRLSSVTGGSRSRLTQRATPSSALPVPSI